MQILPDDASKEQFETSLQIIVSAWNAVVLDSWHRTDSHENSLLEVLDKEPREMQLMVKNLIKRKKKKYSEDLRAVGNYEVLDRNGELVFRAEARGSVKDMDGYEVVQ